MKTALHLLAAFAFVAAAATASAQTTFDFDRYQVLDARVVTSDEMIGQADSSEALDLALEVAIGARTELYNYIELVVGDTTVDAETLDALLRQRSLMALDLVRLYARRGDCDDATGWLQAAMRALHPALRDATSDAQASASSCRPREVAVAAPPSDASTAGQDLTAAPPEPRSKLPGIILVAAGAALGGGAVALDAMGAGDRKTLARLRCDETYCPDESDRDAHDAAHRAESGRALPIAILGGAGIAAAGTGAVLLTRALLSGHDGDGATASLSLTGRHATVGVRW